MTSSAPTGHKPGYKRGHLIEQCGAGVQRRSGGFLAQR
jgi:hypothetical protein